MEISKKNFCILSKIFKEQPWLLDKSQELEKLLFQDCSNDKQKNFIADLLIRFKYISNEEFYKILFTMAGEIAADPELNDDTTQVVAMAANSESDSSQFILYGLKSIFQKLGWEKYKHTNRYDHAYKAYCSSKQHKDIVLVDDFVGTGKTVLNRIKAIQSQFSDKNVSDYSIRIRVLISTNKGANTIISQGLNFKSQITIKKGISDYYQNKELQNKINLMLSLESILKKKHLGRELPSMGWGQTESLYCREHGNSPNSVFPIFWWPIYLNGDRRPTLLYRAMSDA